MDNRPIGIFDSGVGAFSVLNKLVEIMPNENYIYFGDSGHNPYGQKTVEDLQKLCHCIVDFLIKKDVKCIVMACNTATVASLKYLQEKFSLPIIGVINPGAKEAINITQNKKIGVCSTTFTAKTHGYLNEINKITNNDTSIKVYEEGSTNLANIIENGFEYTQQNDDIIKEFVGRFEDDIDTLILGCTHYPLIQDLFEKYFKGNIIDPAMQTALETKSILEENNMLSDRKDMFDVHYFVTKDVEKFKNSAKNLTKLEIEKLKEVSIEDELNRL